MTSVCFDAFTWSLASVWNGPYAVACSSRGRINCAKFYRNRLRGYGFYEWSKFDHSHWIAISPLTLWTTVHTVILSYSSLQHSKRLFTALHCMSIKELLKRLAMLQARLNYSLIAWKAVWTSWNTTWQRVYYTCILVILFEIDDISRRFIFFSWSCLKVKFNFYVSVFSYTSRRKNNIVRRPTFPSIPLENSVFIFISFNFLNRD